MLRVSQQNQGSKLGRKGGTVITHLLYPQLAWLLLEPSDPKNGAKRGRCPNTLHGSRLLQDKGILVVSILPSVISIQSHGDSPEYMNDPTPEHFLCWTYAGMPGDLGENLGECPIQ